MEKRRDQVIQYANDEYWRHTSDLSFIKDLSGVYLRASASFAKMAGRDDPAELLGKTDVDIFADPELARRYQSDDARLLAGGVSLENYVEPIVGKNGRPRYSITSKYILRDADSRPVGIFGTGRDVTVEYEARQNYERELKSLFELPPDALLAVLFDITDWRVVDVRAREGADRVASRYTQIDEYVANVVASVVDGEEARAFFGAFSQAHLQEAFHRGVRNRSLEYLRRMSDGAERWVRDELHLLPYPVNGNLSLIVILRDIDSAKREYHDLIQAAEQDSMTGLLNHDATIRCIERYLAIAKGRQALFMIDLDNFKQFNDQFGHQHGDRVLRDVAAAIRGVFRASDIVGRLGGDEFMALMKNVRSEEAVRQKSDELLSALQFYSGGDYQSAELTSSVGVTLFNAREAAFSALYSEADAALYQAKRAGKNRCCVFGSGQQSHPRGTPSPILDSVSPVQLRVLLDYMDGGVVMAEVDHSIHITYVSPSLYHSFGRDQESLLREGKDITAYVLPEDLPKFRAAVFQAAGSNDLVECTYRVLGRGGPEWRRMRLKRIPETDHGKRRIVAVVTDVSDLRRANEQLREAEERYRIAAEQADMMLWEVDIPHRTLQLKSAAWRNLQDEATLFPNAPESYLQTGLVHPGSIARFRQMFEELYGGDDSGDYYFKIIEKSGEEIWVKNRFRLLRDEEGNLRRALGITQPVPNIGAEMRRFEQETRFVDAVQASLLGYGRFNLTRNAVETSDDDGRFHCAADEEYDSLILRACDDAVHPQDAPAFRHALSRARLLEGFRIREGSRFINYRRKGADGRFHWVCLFIKLMRHPISGDVYAFCYLRDDDWQRGRELAYGAPLALDSTLPLYNQESMAALASHILSDCPPECLAAVSVLDLVGLERVRSELGGPAVSDILFTLGRICRIVVSGEVIFGQLDDHRAVLLRVNADGEEEQRSRVASTVSLMSRLISQAHPEANLSLIGGFAVDRAGQTNYPALLRKADVACRSFSKALNEAVVAYADTGVEPLPPGDPSSLQERYEALELRYQQQGNMLRLLESDELTGVLGKRAFYRRVRELLDGEPVRRLSIVRFDINRFKVYNDVHGTAAGDRLLCEIAALMRQPANPALLTARLESDHFVLLTRDDAAAIERSKERLVSWLAEYDRDFHLSFTVGVYRIADPSLEVSLMCDRALLALRSVKSGFDTKLAYYDDALRDRLLDEQQLVADMEHALESEQFELYFQPQINYENGLVTGAEALVRWNHPLRGLLSPAAFIPLFERNGLIPKLDEYVWERCCRYIQSWRERFPQAEGLSVSVSVNVSRLDIYDPRLCDTLCGLMVKYGLPMAALRLEITESAYMENPRQLIETVNRLQADGFVVEMDDFGSGYSSLNTLKDVAVDVLKLDMKFLAQCADSARGGNILASVIRMAHWLKLPIIAEGVETKAQADYLISLGCVTMQGYYFERPMSAQRFEALLQKGVASLGEQYRSASVEGVAAFWDPSAQTALLFNSFVGGAAVMEYRAGLLEVLRVNDNYYKTLGTSREAYLPEQTNILEHFDSENRRRLLGELRLAIATGEERGCELLYQLDVGGVTRPWIAARIRLLAQNGDSAILYVAIEDITDRKRMEMEQAAENERVRMLMKTTGIGFFSYDYANDALAYQIYLPEQGVVKRQRPRFAKTLAVNAQLHPEDAVALGQRMEEGKRGPTDGELEFRASLWKPGMGWCRVRYASVEDAKGRVYRLVGQVEDIQALKEGTALSEAIGHRLQVSGNAYSYNDGVVARIFDLFYGAADVHGAIETTLSLLGEYLHLSRAYIFEDSPDHLQASNTFEWCAEGITPQMAWLQGVSYEIMGGRESYVAKFDQSGTYYCPDVLALPPEERAMLESQSIRSMLQYAIRNNGVFTGFIGFDECREPRRWSPEQEGTLLLVCRIVASYLLKLREADSAAFSVDFQSALDNSAAYVYIIDPKTYRVIYSNKAIRRYLGGDCLGRRCYEEFVGLGAPCPQCPVPRLNDGQEFHSAEVLRADGRLMLSNASALRWDGRDMAMLACIDVTESRGLQAYLKKQGKSGEARD